MPQEQIKGGPLPEGYVKPQDPVEIYATDKIKGIYNAGDAFTVHSALAEKLIKSGKATRTAPKAGKTETNDKNEKY